MLLRQLPSLDSDLCISKVANPSRYIEIVPISVHGIKKRLIRYASLKNGGSGSWVDYKWRTRVMS